MDTRTVKRPATREAWLAARRSHIGGSEVAAVLGLSPWKTPVDIYLEKTGRRTQEDAPSEAMRLGNELEDYAARRYAEQTGRTVRNYGYMIYDDEAHLVADVDRLVVPDGAKIAALHDAIRTDVLLECKTSGVAWGEGVPAHYEAQVQTYLALTDCARADFAVVFLAPRRDFRCDYSVARDDAVIGALRERTKEWWERHVEGDTPPPATCEADCKALWASSRGIETVAGIDTREAISRLRNLEATIKELEEAAAEARTVIMAAMGDADTLLDADGRRLATWRSAKATEKTDWKAVAETLAKTEEPEFVARIVTANTISKAGVRRFLLAK